jgi:hypothetical protein
MLQEEVFLFDARNSQFPFLGAKIGVFCEATTKLKFGIGSNRFFKNTRPP